MRISEAFEKGPLLIVYICAGDPTPEDTPDLVRRLEKAGADIIELGLPHSDPIADGPTIQAAAQRAIAAGMNTDVYFQAAAAAEVAIPKVFMGYYNMIYARGLDRFARGLCKVRHHRHDRSRSAAGRGRSSKRGLQQTRRGPHLPGGAQYARRSG